MSSKKQKNEVLTKTVINDGDSNEIYIYQLVEYGHFTKVAEIKPFLDVVNEGVDELSEQIKKLYENQGTLATNCQKQLEKKEENHQKQITELNDKITKLEENTKQTDEKSIKVWQDKQALETLLEEQAAEYDNFRENAKDELLKTKEGHERQLEEIEIKLSNTVQKYNEQIKKLESEKIALQKQLEAVRKNNEENSEPLGIMSSINRHFNNAEKTLSSVKNNELTGSQNSSERIRDTIPVIQSNSLTSVPAISQNNDENNHMSIKMTHSLPSFSGRPHENVSDWLFTTNRLIEMCNYSDRKKVVVASAYLKDYALQIYNIHEHSKGELSWEEFKTFMKSYFTPKNSSKQVDLSKTNNNDKRILRRVPTNKQSTE
jgi:hypothetical protein